MNLKQLIKNDHLKISIERTGFDIDRIMKIGEYEEYRSILRAKYTELGEEKEVTIMAFTDENKEYYLIVAEEYCRDTGELIREYKNILTATGETYDYDTSKDPMDLTLWTLATKASYYGIPVDPTLQRPYGAPYLLHQTGGAVTFMNLQGEWQLLPRIAFTKIDPPLLEEGDLVKVLLPEGYVNGVIVDKNWNEDDPTYYVVKDGDSSSTFSKVHWPDLRNYDFCPICEKYIGNQKYDIMEDYLKGCEKCNPNKYQKGDLE